MIITHEQSGTIYSFESWTWVLWANQLLESYFNHGAHDEESSKWFKALTRH